ncbi:MAG: glycerol kinase GlpK [Pseudomonadota bacterium]
MSGHILAIDQGTTSSRAILFDEALRPVAASSQEFRQIFPQSGWVEHDPADLWASVAATARAAIERAGIDIASLAAIGLTNQRETTLLWDRQTGEPLMNAIVWQDRRTADLCDRLRADGAEAMVTERTGLVLDPYFSASKLAWMLDNLEGARAKAEAGRLAFGTVDTFLIWRLTGGKVHATDVTNASRTALFNIHTLAWDEALLDLFAIPRAVLPEVKACTDDFGMTRPDLFGRPIPLRGLAGDQQAATVGQGCFEPGMVKSTYGTGCFALLNTGLAPVASSNRLLTTLAYQIDGQTTYALEGSIFVAGAAVQWLRDGLKLVREAEETDGLAASARDGSEVYLVPAFTGLGAPYWDATCRGAIFGLTRADGAAEIARATLESVGYQTRDLLEAMARDWAAGEPLQGLRVDGGMTASDRAMQFLADILGVSVDRPAVIETTALGAAWLAGREIDLYPPAEDFSKVWRLERRFEPSMTCEERDRRYAGWQEAVARTLTTKV